MNIKILKNNEGVVLKLDDEAINATDAQAALAEIGLDLGSVVRVQGTDSVITIMPGDLWPSLRKIDEGVEIRAGEDFHKGDCKTESYYSPMPQLESVGSGVVICDKLVFDKLRKIDGATQLGGGVKMPSLEMIRGQLWIADDKPIELPSLVAIGGSLLAYQRKTKALFNSLRFVGGVVSYHSCQTAQDCTHSMGRRPAMAAGQRFLDHQKSVLEVIKRSSETMSQSREEDHEQAYHSGLSL